MQMPAKNENEARACSTSRASFSFFSFFGQIRLAKGQQKR
jgi:hypothetical protein